MGQGKDSGAEARSCWSHQNERANEQAVTAGKAGLHGKTPVLLLATENTDHARGFLSRCVTHSNSRGPKGSQLSLRTYCPPWKVRYVAISGLQSFFSGRTPWIQITSPVTWRGVRDTLHLPTSIHPWPTSLLFGGFGSVGSPLRDIYYQRKVHVGDNQTCTVIDVIYGPGGHYHSK